VNLKSDPPSYTTMSWPHDKTEANTDGSLIVYAYLDAWPFCVVLERPLIGPSETICTPRFAHPDNVDVRGQ
jgi:hypothetical protein